MQSAAVELLEQAERVPTHVKFDTKASNYR